MCATLSSSSAPTSPLAPGPCTARSEQVHEYIGIWGATPAVCATPIVGTPSSPQCPLLPHSLSPSGAPPPAQAAAAAAGGSAAPAIPSISAPAEKEEAGTAELEAKEKGEEAALGSKKKKKCLKKKVAVGTTAAEGGEVQEAVQEAAARSYKKKAAPAETEDGGGEADDPQV